MAPPLTVAKNNDVSVVYAASAGTVFISISPASLEGLKCIAIFKTEGTSKYWLPSTFGKRDKSNVFTADHMLTSLTLTDEIRSDVPTTYAIYLLTEVPAERTEPKKGEFPVVIREVSDGPSYGLYPDREELVLTVGVPASTQSIHDAYFNVGYTDQDYSKAFAGVAVNSKSAGILESRSRGLYEAMCDFVRQCQSSDHRIEICCYEFDYLPFVMEVGRARERGAEVVICLQWKEATWNESQMQWDLEKAMYSNRCAIEAAKLSDCVVKRQGKNASAISHNKFIVFSERGVPKAVWTGSTNFTSGGIYGQWNVGHVVRCEKIAQAYHSAFEILRKDPKDGDARAAFQNITVDSPAGKVLFCPRQTTSEVFDEYKELASKAKQFILLTIPFGLSTEMLEVLLAVPEEVPILILMEPGVRDWSQKNLAVLSERLVFIAVGSVVFSPSQFGASPAATHLEESLTGLNQHVRFIHTKFMVVDFHTLVTGSANFSKNSVLNNDENVLVINGSAPESTPIITRYFVEFMRVFLHYTSRQLVNKSLSHQLCGRIDSTNGSVTKWEKSLNYARRLSAFEAKHAAEIIRPALNSINEISKTSITTSSRSGYSSFDQDLATFCSVMSSLRLNLAN